MIFYFVHNLVHSFARTWTESQKNLFTFSIGGTLHCLLYITLQYYARVTQNAYLELLSRFYLMFVLIDAATMAILYKLYWGRSILNEMTEDQSEWVLDDNSHQYVKVPKPVVQAVPKVNKEESPGDVRPNPMTSVKTEQSQQQPLLEKPIEQQEQEEGEQGEQEQQEVQQTEEEETKERSNQERQETDEPDKHEEQTDDQGMMNA